MTDITLPGVVVGQTIQLTGVHGIRSGQRVEVTIKVIDAVRKSGERFSILAKRPDPEWTEEDRRILDEIHRDRSRTSLRDRDGLE